MTFIFAIKRFDNSFEIFTHQKAPPNISELTAATGAESVGGLSIIFSWEQVDRLLEEKRKIRLALHNQYRKQDSSLKWNATLEEFDPNKSHKRLQ